MQCLSRYRSVNMNGCVKRAAVTRGQCKSRSYFQIPMTYWIYRMTRKLYIFLKSICTIRMIYMMHTMISHSALKNKHFQKKRLILLLGVKMNERKKWQKSNRMRGTTLNDKGNYVLHYRMLKLAMRHGLVLKKVHRILKFRQSEWLKPYISLNTEMRTKSKSEIEKSFYKLMNNAI